MELESAIQETNETSFNDKYHPYFWRIILGVYEILNGNIDFYNSISRRLSALELGWQKDL